jgi:hypothetical protein
MQYTGSHENDVAARGQAPRVRIDRLETRSAEFIEIAVSVV